MNVVGKVGSLISQGVYSVATPFHPFGGAVDVIAVQQQDGSFRSTPWYVRFGKFQGVLKGAEKVVRITVNGVEANFHMYLDNSGEAYFVREVDSVKVSEPNGSGELTTDDGSFVDSNFENRTAVEVSRLQHSVSDSGVSRIRNECDTLSADRIQRTESDGDRGFYEFQDEQSSLEGSVEISDYGNLDVEPYRESQGSDSEVILVSVDGHVLTAPVLPSEQTTENIQLSTPQFHLGPGEGAEFVEGNGEFTSSDNVWDEDYISKLNSSTADVACDNDCSRNNDDIASSQQLEVYEGEGEHICPVAETENIPIKHGDPQTGCGSANIRREDVFGSCVELTELAKQEIESSLEIPVSAEKSLESHLGGETEDGNKSEEVDETRDDETIDVDTNEGVNKDEDADVVRNDDGLSSACGLDSPSKNSSPDLEVERDVVEDRLDTENVVSDNECIDFVSNETEWKDEQISVSEEMEDSLHTPMHKDDCSKSECVEPQGTISSEGMLPPLGFEISLCGNELHSGMGSDAAAEAFDIHRVSEDEFKTSAASIIKNENLVIRFRGRYLPWEKAAPIVLGMAAFGLELSVEPTYVIPVEQEEQKSKDNDSNITSTPSGRRWRLWPIPFRRVKTLEHTSSNSSSEEVFVDSECALQNPQDSPVSTANIESPRKQFIRTNVPTSEQISSLNLKDGQNMVTFSFCTRVLGMQQVEAHLYLWKWNTKIVISDVDGTITKSDVLGQFMPLVGKDWTQSGVAKLFSAIKENGYQLLFLSARAIVQAYLTRSFLLNLKQDGNALPSGPVVISPDGLFPSLFREVIRRAPHEFKIACLEDIKKLFPADHNPFYAGFGNRDTDELSYRKIGIPKGKIFIINPKGEVAISHRVGVKSYTSLHTLVNDMFPPTSLVEQEDYNSWNFWKLPLPEVDF